jgi:hypothetical protein
MRSFLPISGRFPGGIGLAVARGVQFLQIFRIIDPALDQPSRRRTPAATFAKDRSP